MKAISSGLLGSWSRIHFFLIYVCIYIMNKIQGRAPLRNQSLCECEVTLHHYEFQ